MLKETILSDGASMGIHESQSRFYENIKPQWAIHHADSYHPLSLKLIT